MSPSARATVLFIGAWVTACKASSATDTPDATEVADVGETAVVADSGTCGVLFGRPNDLTGLTADQCAPQCGCEGDAFVPPTYGDAFIQSLTTDFALATPYAALTSDPYSDASPPDDPSGTVCGVLEQGDPAAKPRSYTLVTYASAEAALVVGAHVTHFGHCGVCSTLPNLAVYMKNNDLTAPVRSCGIQPSSDGGTQFDADVACLESLGFDLPCAQAWAYDTAHTRNQCISICIQHLSDPYNLPDGALNPCLQCDEDESGPVFKYVAGRTRRNSGLPNAICRSCSEVQPLTHNY
ncbi:MAG: hypothetical protein ACHREM_00715 [Polyangiales bacterium]